MFHYMSSSIDFCEIWNKIICMFKNNFAYPLYWFTWWNNINSFPLILRVKAACFHLTIKVLLHACVLTLICACHIFKATFGHYNFPNANLNLHSHDLRVPVGSLSRFKLSLPQCNVPGVLNCMPGRLSGCPSLNWRYLCISYENNNYWQNPKVNMSSNLYTTESFGKFVLPPS